MFCYKCGKQLDDGAKFCLNCGAVVNNEQNITTDDGDYYGWVDENFIDFY